MAANLFISRIAAILLPLCMVMTAVFFLYRDPPLVQWLRIKSFDSYNQLLPRQPGHDTAIVAIDEESIKRLGQWPWPRSVMGDLAIRLRKMGAKAVAFDIVFAEPDRTARPGGISNDTLFARKIAEAGHIILAFGGASEPTGNDPAWSVPIRENGDANPYRFFFAPKYFLTPLPSLAAVANGGAIASAPEEDGIVRRVPLMIGKRDAAGRIKTLLPSLSLEALRVAFDLPGYSLHYETYRSTPYVVGIQLGQSTIPTNENGSLWFYDAGHRPELYIPAWRILAGEVAESRIKNKIVFVGATAQGLMDISSSPLRVRMPGVEFHAEMTEQILHGQYLHRTRTMVAAEILSAGFCCLLLIMLAPIVGVAWLSFITAILFALNFIGGLSLYDAFGWLIDPIWPSLVILTTFVSSSVFIHLEANRREQEFLFHARHDVLTGLENRAAFTLALERAVARASRRSGQHVALLMIDLDGFKAVNDTHGHTAGDLALKAVAERLRACQRAGDVICRLGGDEFAVILEGPSSSSSEIVAQKIVDSISIPISLKTVAVQLGCSIGISVYPTLAGTLSSLIEQADAAMYAVKKNGKNNYRFFSWDEMRGEEA